MGGNGIDIIHWLVTGYGYVLALRFMLQATQADFYNPVSQYVTKFSDPVCQPVRKFTPAVGRIDIASIALLILLFFGFWFVALKGNVIAALAYTGFHVVGAMLNVLFVALIILVIVSWLLMANPTAAQNPVWPIVNQLIEPLAAPLRRVIPPLGGLDLSVLVLFLGIQFAKMLNGQFWSLWLR